MKVRAESWETELWSYFNNNKGTDCPVYDFCRLRIKGINCLSTDVEYADRMHKFIDSDTLDLSSFEFNIHKLPECVGTGRIFELVRKLAYSYRDNTNIDQLPVPDDLIKHACDDQPIEVRLVPLKAYHGAVWHLKDSWVIHLNSIDSSARRRFTLYHEIFHILAHCNANPVFKKAPPSKEGIFNELLADQFSAVMLVPENLLEKKWQEVKDISKIAAIFDVPEPVVYCGLKFMRLI